MVRPVIGTVWAQDGWSLWWDIRATPHKIDVYDFVDTMQYRISGDIPQAYLEREITQFLRDHAAQQMEMEM
jgi:hypothetical protein